MADDRDYSPLPYEYLEEMEELSDTEFGRLVRSLLRYSMEGTPIALCGNERFYAKRVMNREDRYKQGFRELSDARREAGVKGATARWENGKRKEKDSKNGKRMANDSNGIASDSKNGYTNTETNTNTENGGYTHSAGARVREDRSDDDDGYERFLDAYPRVTGDPAANYRAYHLAITDGGATLEAMLTALAWQREEQSWRECGGKYIPSPEKWLNNRGWARQKPPDDAPPGMEKKSVTFYDVAEKMMRRKE